MTFYFNRETGQRVSKETWKRSHAQGGTRFVRRGTTRSVAPKKEKETVPERGATPPLAPSQSPRTWQEWKAQAEKKFKKKIQQNDFDFDNGVEYETGVDY